MNHARPPELARRLALASHELRLQMPPATLLPAIHRALVRGRWKSPGPKTRLISWLGWGGLSTACAAIAAAFVVNSMMTADVQDSAQLDSGFVALVNDEAWQRAALTDSGRMWLVTTEMPQARLAALGLPYDPARAGERVSAQLLMHSSGDVLAVRVNH
jgi:hypothetical protein